MSNMPSNTPVMGSGSGPAGWLPVWIKAVTQPNEQTFISITDSPDATSKTAFIWVFIVGTLSTIVSGLISSLLLAVGVVQQPGLEELSQSGGDVMAFAVGGSLITTLCLSPVAGLVSVIFFAIGVAIIQWVAKMFGGNGTFDKLAYALAAISVPFSLVSMFLSPLNSVPYVNYCTTGLLSVLGIYVFVLQIMAVKGVNGFGWGPAIGSVLIVPGVLILCACLTLIPLMLMGPGIGDVFSQINQSLSSP